MAHVLTIDQLGFNRCNSILTQARQLRDGVIEPPRIEKNVALAFFEPSTRTRMSFEVAAKKLNCFVSVFTVQGSSVQKGENFMDTIRTLEALGFDIIVIRHYCNGAAEYAATFLTHSQLINAGDGAHEHPTQALLDALTLIDVFGSLSDVHVAIIGDIIHSRVFRSNLSLLSMLGSRVGICAPPLLIPRVIPWNVEILPTARDALQWADAIIVLRLQRERMKHGLVPSLSDYRQRYAVRHADIEQSRAWILHPGPVNPGVELDAELITHRQSLILRQVTNGVYVRMAVLANVLDVMCNNKM